MHPLIRDAYGAHAVNVATWRISRSSRHSVPPRGVESVCHRRFIQKLREDGLIDIDARPIVVEMVATQQSGIKLTKLTKSYGDVKAVRGIDLTITPGETLALLGPNGAGKTTTIDMMLGLIRPDAGTVSLFGMTPTEGVDAGVVGGMLQTGQLPGYLSVRELITMMASLYPHPLAVDDVIRHTGATEFADRPTTKLSGGQTQRVRMAIALVADPELLVLDEPTAALDVEGRRDFWTAIRAVAARGKTIVFATHYLEEADAYADRIVLMARGEIVADGNPSEIKARVGGRTIRATVPGADLSAIQALAGVTRAEQRGDGFVLTSTDSAGSDAALRDLLTRFPGARDIEVRGAGLEEAFLNLTGDDDGEHAP
jgi:ABC-2 type transport system ATP-binding protein